MEYLKVIVGLMIFILNFNPGRLLSMLSQGQVAVLHAGQTVALDCEFYTEYFSLFDNPVLWTKFQHHEETPLNIMGNIIEPFVNTGRFNVTFDRTHPRYRLKLKISDVIAEDSGNYTCEIRGPRSAILGIVTHYIFVRAPVHSIFIFDSNNIENREKYTKNSVLEFREGRKSAIRCISEGGYPPPEMDIYLGNRDLTEQFSIRHSAELHGETGMRLMMYRTERWTESFQAEGRDDGDRIKCIVTVPGLGSNTSAVKIHVQYAPVIKCASSSAYSGDTNVFLRCEVKARPGVTALYWEIGNGSRVGPMEDVQEMWTLTKDMGDVLETKLFIPVVREESFKKYSVVALNSISKTMVEVELQQDFMSRTESSPAEIVDSGQKQSSSSHGRRSEKSGFEYMSRLSRLTASATVLTYTLLVILVCR